MRGQSSSQRRITCSMSVSMVIMRSLLLRLQASLLVSWSLILLDNANAAFVPSKSCRRFASRRTSGKPIAGRPIPVPQLHSWNASQNVEVMKSVGNGVETEVDNLGRESLVKEAEELRQRARELKAEASALESSMKQSRSFGESAKNEESDAMIDRLFSGNITAIQLASRLDRERWSPDQLSTIVDRLHERQLFALGQGSLSISATEGFQLADTRNSAAKDEIEWGRLDLLLRMLLEAAGTLDEKHSNGTIQNRRWTGRVSISLSSRLKELQRTEDENFKRRLAVAVNSPTSGNLSEALQGYMSTSLGLSAEGQSSSSFNISRVMEQVALVPMWVPSSILPFLLVSRVHLETGDVKRIKEEVLAGTQFYCTSSDSIPAAAIFRGNLRTPVGLVNTTMERNHSAVIFEMIQQKLEKTGMAERIQLFFWNDPEWRPSSAEREKSPPPVLLALPKTVVPEQAVERALPAKLLAGTSVLLTFVGTFAYAISCYALNPGFFQSVINQRDLSVLTTCLPLFVGVFFIQTVHEMAHRFVAKRRGISIGLPVPLPSSQIGNFCSITPLRSFPSNRAALLDFALSGPVAGMVTSIALLVGGVFATLYASSGAIAHFPVMPAAVLKSSFLVGSLLSVIAPKTMLLPLAQPVPVHPTFMMGFAGLISNALNMLPIGRLDGGRAYSSVFGTRNAVLASLASLTMLSLLSLTGMSAVAIFWGLLVIVFQRQPEIPVRNEVTEVSDVRVGLYCASLSLALLALAPFPGGQGML